MLFIRHAAPLRGIFDKRDLLNCSWAIPPIGNCTLPRRFYLVVEIIPYRALCISVCFDDAIDRANSDALG